MRDGDDGFADEIATALVPPSDQYPTVPTLDLRPRGGGDVAVPRGDLIIVQQHAYLLLGHLKGHCRSVSDWDLVTGILDIVNRALNREG